MKEEINFIGSNTMRIVLLFSIAMLIQVEIAAQVVSGGLYVNEKSNEFVYIYNDSIQFRLYNHDAMATSSIGKGYYRYKGKDKYFVQSKYLGKETSVINVVPRTDSSLTVKILYKNDTPIVSAYVYFKEANNAEKEHEIICVSDEEGMIELTENQISKLNNKELILEVETIGFSTEKNVLLKKGHEYIVRSVISKENSFTLFKSGKISIKEISPKEIEVEIWRKKCLRKRRGTTRLIKVDTPITYSLWSF